MERQGTFRLLRQNPGLFSGVALVASALALTGALTGTTADFSGAVSTNTVNEHTTNAGVTVDGVWHKDAAIYPATIYQPVAGSAQIALGVADVITLTAPGGVNVSTTVDGVDLSANYAGRTIELFGDGSDGTVNCTGLVQLSRPMYYANLTVGVGCQLDVRGWPIYVSGTLDLSVSGGGTIESDYTVTGGGGMLMKIGSSMGSSGIGGHFKNAGRLIKSLGETVGRTRLDASRGTLYVQRHHPRISGTNGAAHDGAHIQPNGLSKRNGYRRWRNKATL
jgi:hypothetical protein